MKAIRFAFFGLLIGALGSFEAQALVYHVEIRNLDEVQPMTPPVAVVHGENYTMFEVGGTATTGLEALAEDGMTAELVLEAEASGDVSEVVVGGSGPTFGVFKFLIEGDPGDLFSVASMFAKTNDNFIGTSGVMLPADEPLTINSMVYDAGTEVNTGLAADIPAFGNVEVGQTEGGTIQTITSFTLQDDPELGMVEIAWPPAAEIIITPMPNAVEYSIELMTVTEGQPLTPPVLVVHNDMASVFEIGDTASDGLEALAEEGMTGMLVNELTPIMGVYQVEVISDGPGMSHSGTFIAKPGMLMSLVSMFARTNDIITGAMSMELPEAGASMTIETNAYDAGTEENTGMVADIPFYGNVGIGPEENGTITEITAYTVVDDAEMGILEYSWPPAAELIVQAIAPTSNVNAWNLYR